MGYHTGKAPILGLMGPNTSVNGRVANFTGRAPILGLMGTNTSVNGRITKNTGKAPTPMPMVEFGRVVGRRVSG
jgi:hypothetical protein